MNSVPSAAKVVQGFKEYHSVSAMPSGVAWVESNPATGRNRLFLSEAGRITGVTPEPLSVCSRVNEYGGVAWVPLNDAFAWVNATDQQIWISPYPTEDQAVNLKDASYPLTATPQRRFADFIYDAQHQRLLAVCETHVEGASEPQHSLVSINGSTGAVVDIIQGADFYAYPRLSPDGNTLVWVEWQHPYQPWLSTQLVAMQLNVDGTPIAATRTVLADNASWLQPGFSCEGDLVALGDPHNWWNPFVFKRTAEGGYQPPEPGYGILSVEFTTAPWALGLKTYAWDTQGNLHALVQTQGVSQYWLYTPATQAWQSISLPFSRLSSLSLSSTHAYMVAEAEDRYPAVIAVSLGSAAWQLIRGGDRPDMVVSRPSPYWVEANTGQPVQSFYYPPTGRLCSATQAPPLIVLTHGGPTSATYPVWNPRIQYWTSAGFAVVDVNYRGSCGYGRDFRLALQGGWGKAEVEDVEVLVDALVEEGLANTDALYIRGQSAGGYTTLMALIHSARFKAGASLYGVSDLASLHEQTHKFESHYLSWLVGDNEELSNTERSPMHQAQSITAGVIFFQGLEDKVVLPEQTQGMVAALKEQGTPVQVRYFANEAHGFRLAAHQQQVLEEELEFYMGFMTY